MAPLSPYLGPNHPALCAFVETYCELLRASFFDTDFSGVTIVCERKEDIVTVRSQIFAEVQQRLGPQQALSGLTLYTLDTLGRQLCSSWAQEFSQCRLPYLDVVQQEQLVELILNLFGYRGSDARPLAKQILLLIDLPLGPDHSLFDLLANQYGKQWPIALADIHLKQILATFQFAKMQLGCYSRLQNCVGLDPCLLGDHAILLPEKIFKNPLLWVSAIEYQHVHGSERPGNFSTATVDDFKHMILKGRKALSKNLYWEVSPCMQESEGTTLNLHHVRFVSFSDLYDFYGYVSQNKNTLPSNTTRFLGDLPKSIFASILRDGSGEYRIHAPMITRAINVDPVFVSDEKILSHIEHTTNEFWDQVALVSLLNEFFQVAQTYQLNWWDPKGQGKPLDFKKLLQVRLEKSDLFMGELPWHQHPLPQALSLVPCLESASHLQVWGPPHGRTGASLCVKQLNRCLLQAQSLGLSVTLPASDAIYKTFWKHMIANHESVEFLILSSDQATLPQYVDSCVVLPFEKPEWGLKHGYIVKHMAVHHDSFLGTHFFSIPDWKTRFSFSPYALSVTQLERYITCPAQFLFQDLLKLAPDHKPHALDVDRMHLGSDVHAQLEAWVRQEYGLAQHAELASESPIKKEFVDYLYAAWMKRLLKKALEIQKFVFLKKYPVFAPQAKGFVAVEKNLVVTLGSYRLYGKIDRLHVHESTRQVVLIDYKTGKVRDAKVTFLPSAAAESPASYLLSVQGALYTLGWLQNEGGLTLEWQLWYLHGEHIAAEDCVKGYVVQADSPLWGQVSAEYLAFLERLHQGDFAPNPLQKEQTCRMCEFAQMCPKYG